VPTPPGASRWLRLLAALLVPCFVIQARGADSRPFRGIDTAPEVNRLVHQGTADALAAAALLRQIGADTDTGAYALSAQAVRLAPARAEFAWLAMRLCDTSDSCDAQPVERHLQEIDADNAAGWVGALGRAQRRSDVQAVDAALDSMGRAGSFRVYFEPLVAATTQQLLIAATHSGKPVDAMARASMTMTMIGVVASAVLPGTRIFSYSCQGSELQVKGRLARCRAASASIERSDAYIVQGLGLSLQQKLWPADSAEYSQVSERRRVFQYRLEKYNTLALSSSDPAQFPADYLEMARKHEREQDVALAYFARAGIPPDPPPDWVSLQPARVP